MTCNVCALCFSHNREAWWLFPGGSGAFMVSKCYWTPRIVSLVTYLKRLFVHQTLLSMSRKMYWFINHSKLLLCKHDALFAKKWSRENKQRIRTCRWYIYQMNIHRNSVGFEIQAVRICGYQNIFCGELCLDNHTTHDVWLVPMYLFISRIISPGLNTSINWIIRLLHIFYTVYIRKW